MYRISIIMAIALAAGVLAGPPLVPETPVAPAELIYARPFQLDESFPFLWRKERSQVTEGTLLVIKADKELLVPRAAPMPVLLVGDQTVQQLNYGHESGYRVVIVPGHPDLEQTPIWFAAPNYPDWMDATAIQAERVKAEAAGIRPFAAKQIQAARDRGGRCLQAKSLDEVLRTEAAELILRYSPQERHIAEGYRVPVVQRHAATNEE
jgi:hypothetical protein